MGKKAYLIEDEKIIFRRANLDDDLNKIAELIYKTDPYIYPFWFNNDIEEAKKYLVSLMKKDGNLFNINNFYIAFDTTYKKIVGIICAVDKSVDLDYKFRDDMKINERYDFTIKNYILEIQDIAKSSKKDLLYISNVCVIDDHRGKRIGSHLIGFFISHMEHAGYNEFELDCLLHNLRAKNLYHSMGFKEMKEVVGFDGTDHSTVEVVNFLRKKGNYYPEEFQISIMD